MRIVIIDKEEPTVIGGMGKYSERIRLYLDNLGHEVYFLRFSNKKTTDKHTIHLPYYPVDPRYYIFLPALNTYKTIEDQLRRLHPDIVYTYIGLSPIDFLIPKLCKKLDIPLAGVWHADYPESGYWIKSYMVTIFRLYMPVCKSIDLFHVFSDHMKKFHEKYGVNPGKIMILSNGVDPTFYTPGHSTFRKKHNIDTGILLLGRLSLQKNPQALLQAFIEINPPRSTKLVVVGGGDMEQALRKKYKDTRIIFTGIITNDKEKRDIIRACSVTVQPSLMEGVSLAMLEAMSCGLAVISSDAGNYMDILRNSGKIIPIPSLKKELPLILYWFLSHPNEVKNMGIHARESIRKEHSEEFIYGKLINAFKNTIQKYRSPHAYKKNG